MEEERGHSHNPPTRVVPQGKKRPSCVPAVGSLSRAWYGWNTRRKALSLLSRVVLPLALVGAIYIAIRPDYVPLVSMTDTQRLGEITNYLDLNDIDYEVKGNTILVARRQRDQVRLDLAVQKILGPTIGPGFELFDTARLGMTDRIFDAQYVRALQNELARTIRNGLGFETLNLYVSIPKEALCEEDQVLPSAAVRITTPHGISQQQVIAIQNLVAGAVPKLKPENVKVFDGTNKLLAGVTGENVERGTTLKGSSHE